MAQIGTNGIVINPVYGDVSTQGAFNGITISGFPESSLIPFTTTFYSGSLGEIPKDVKEANGILYDRFYFTRLHHSPSSLVIGGIAGNDSDYDTYGLTLGSPAARLKNIEEGPERYHVVIGAGALAAENETLAYVGTHLGTSASNRAVNVSATCAVGTFAGRWVDNSDLPGDYFRARNTFVGEYCGPFYSPAQVRNCTFVGNTMGNNLDKSIGETIDSTSVGIHSLYSAKRAHHSTLMGARAAFRAEDVVSSILIGRSAGYNYNNIENSTIIGTDFVGTAVDVTGLCSIGVKGRVDFESDGDKVTIGGNATPTEVFEFIIANASNLNYADDAAAATGGVPVNGIYHTNGAIKVRLS